MNITLLNTRPKHQSDRLNEMLAEQGIASISLPTLDIHINPNALIEVNSKKQMRAFDKVIFISRNAVDGFIQQKQFSDFEYLFNKAQFYAIGKATQQAGLEAGLKLQTPSNSVFDSEHLLAHESMHNISTENILLVKGVGGRNLLAERLVERGGNLIALEVYERVPAEFSATQWQAFLVSEKPTLLITSLASWQVLITNLKMHYSAKNLDNESFFTLPFWTQIFATVVMSKRIANEIEQQGWQGNLKIVETQSNQGIIDSLREN